MDLVILKRYRGRDKKTKEVNYDVELGILRRKAPEFSIIYTKRGEYMTRMNDIIEPVTTKNVAIADLLEYTELMLNKELKDLNKEDLIDALSNMCNMINSSFNLDESTVYLLNFDVELEHEEPKEIEFGKNEFIIRDHPLVNKKPRHDAFLEEHDRILREKLQKVNPFVKKNNI